MRFEGASSAPFLAQECASGPLHGFCMVRFHFSIFVVFHGRVSFFFRASESDVRQLFRVAVLAGFWVGRAC